MRLIDADTVVNIQTYDEMYEEWGTETMTVAQAMDKFSDEGCPPTVDAEPVRHGRWENEVEKYPEMYGYIPLSQVVCSVCDRAQEKKTSYCPNCGAKMDKGVEA